MKFLRDPAWQGASVVVAVIAALLQFSEHWNWLVPLLAFLLILLFVGHRYLPVDGSTKGDADAGLASRLGQVGRRFALLFKRWFAPTLMLASLVVAGAFVVIGVASNLQDMNGGIAMGTTPQGVVVHTVIVTATSGETGFVVMDTPGTGVQTTLAPQTTEVAVLNTPAITTHAIVEQQSPIPAGTATSKPTPEPRETIAPAQATSTPRPTVEVPTVAVGAEGSVVRLMTGLGVAKEIVYDQVETGDGTLNTVLNQRRSASKQSQIVVRTDGTVNMIMPLCVLRYAEQTDDGRQQMIALADGSQLLGELVILVKDAADQTYDLLDAKSMIVVSLAEQDQCINFQGHEQDTLWRLEIGEPSYQTHSVVDPRFVFPYSHINSVGSWYTYYATTRKFYLVEDESARHLANLGDFDAVTIGIAERYEPRQTTVTVGGNETIGGIIAVSDNLEEESQGWLLVADLADRDVTIAVSSSAESVLQLSREDVSAP